VKLSWTRSADADLAAVLAYVAAESPAAAQRLLAAIDRALKLAARFPCSGRPAPGGEESPHPSGTRELVVRPYRIGYAPGQSEIVVLYVVHSARRFPPLR
jgi:toxin ParE1/3/4